MGIPMSLMQGLGFTGIKSLTADKVFDKYFPINKITSFGDFHENFLNLCSDINSVMLGKHYNPPSNDNIKECFEKWKRLKDDVTKDDDTKKMERKKLVLDLLTKNVKEIKSGEAIVFTGLVIPPSLMVLKKSSQNVPQLKRFRLDLVPDILFVPTMSIAALIAVKVLQLNMGRKTK